MSSYVQEVLDDVKKQLYDHWTQEAKHDARTLQQRKEHLLDENTPMNLVFPWLCASFVNKLVGGDIQDTVIPSGILKASYLYKFMEQLSTGNGYMTYLGVMRRNDLWCTIRVYPFDKIKGTTNLPNKEAKTLTMISGNRFFSNLITCFKTLSGFYIVKDYIKSTPLHNFIKLQERFNDEELRFYAEELVSAIDFLHSKCIIHRELSASNINLTTNGHIKVINLQNAYIAINEDGTRQTEPEAYGMFGLDVYMAPEMINQELYGYSVDWWCVGVLLYFMMNGRFPFRGSTKRELHRSIQYSSPVFDTGLHSDETIDLVRALLHKSPAERLGRQSSEEVKNHKYFEDTNWSKVINCQSDPPFIPATSAVTFLPPALCVSLDDLNMRRGVVKTPSWIQLQREQAHKIMPDEFMEFELEHDWTTYLHHDVPFQSAVHYVHGELKPPRLEDEGVSLENCKTQVTRLTPEEKKQFLSFFDNDREEPEEYETREVDANNFLLLTQKEARKLERDPEVVSRRLSFEFSTQDKKGQISDTFSSSKGSFLSSSKRNLAAIPSLAKVLKDKIKR